MKIIRLLEGLYEELKKLNETISASKNNSSLLEFVQLLNNAIGRGPSK